MNKIISSNSILSLFRYKSPEGLYLNQLIDADNILILAPHPDDEIMGCGGTIIKYHKKGSAIHILYLSDGRFGVSGQDTNSRKSEALAIKEIIPTVKQYFFYFEDSSLSENIGDLQLSIQKLITAIKPDIIFTPWILDHHDDHIATTIALAKAIESENTESILSMYEIMSPVFGNHSVNITSEFDTKKLLLNKYHSQVQRYNILNISSTLNVFRSELSRRKSVEAMECFLTINSNDFIKIITSLTEGVNENGKK